MYNYVQNLGNCDNDNIENDIDESDQLTADDSEDDVNVHMLINKLHVDQ